MFTQFKIKSEYIFLLPADNLFCDLTAKSLASLDKIKQTKRFRKGVGLFSTGEMPGGIYLLREGRAQLLINDESKDKTIVRLIAPNEIFGLTEACANLPYETDAQAVTTCLCEFIEREDFIRFLRREPALCFRLVRILAMHFQKHYRLISSIIK